MYGLSAKQLAVVKRWPLYRGSNKSQCMDCLPKKGLCREVAIVQRFKQESTYGLSAKKKAFVERWPLYRGSNKSKCMDCLPKKRPLYRGGHCTEVQTRVNVWTVCQKIGRCGEVSISGGSTVHKMLILCPQNCYRKVLLFCTKVHV